MGKVILTVLGMVGEMPRELNRRTVPTATDKPWSPVMVIRVRKRLQG
jgi:hypothetical protein